MMLSHQSKGANMQRHAQYNDDNSRGQSNSIRRDRYREEEENRINRNRRGISGIDEYPRREISHEEALRSLIPKVGGNPGARALSLAGTFRGPTKMNGDTNSNGTITRAWRTAIAGTTRPTTRTVVTIGVRAAPRKKTVAGAIPW